ncbi:MAG: hypothetical protein IT354_13820 [Gemmatimonadaceae bacterium]|nr:hypothetical protein [Gemmatimonadaceae bacterium]
MDSHTGTQPSATAAALAARWAAVSLGATLLSGLWLRTALTWPAFSGGVNLLHAVHAHSHVAFFGWLVLSVASVAARQTTFSAQALGQWRLLVHALGVLSLVALGAFAVMGYAAPTIALSAVHVLLWIPLVRLLWPLTHATAAQRAWWRASFRALLLAGAATLMPAVFVARGIREGWWREFGIKLFLALFINGFAGFAALGLLSSSGAERGDHAGSDNRDPLAWPRRMMTAALIPLAVLYVSTPAPAAWLVWSARAAVGIMGVGTAWVLVQAMQTPRSGWRWLAWSAWGVVAILELVAATGVGTTLLHQRPVTLAFTHLVLLLSVSPVLAAALTQRPHAHPRVEMRGNKRVELRVKVRLNLRMLVATGGGALMCISLAALGWPWLSAQVSALGVNALQLMTVIAVASAVAATAWLTFLPSIFRADAPEPR